MVWQIETITFSLVALVAAALLGLFPDLVPTSLQLIALGLGVVILGLPHGALDPHIASQTGLVYSRRSLMAFNGLYAAIVLGVITIWFMVPVLSLALFLMVSAFHFSGDWRHTLPTWAQWLSGASLLLMPIAFHTTQTAQIFETLSGPGGADLAQALSSLKPLVPLTLLAISAFALIRRQFAAALELACLTLLGVIAPPLMFFIIYFCLLHSPRHMREHFQAAPPSTHTKLLGMLVTYTLATLLLLSPLIWFWHEGQAGQTLLRIVFIGLAAVTVPHMMLMTYSQRKKITEPNAED